MKLNSLDAADLLFAVLTRGQVVRRMIEEAQDKMNGSLEFELKQELIRLEVLRDRLEELVDEEFEYKDVALDRLFSKG